MHKTTKPLSWSQRDFSALELIRLRLIASMYVTTHSVLLDRVAHDMRHGQATRVIEFVHSIPGGQIAAHRLPYDVGILQVAPLQPKAAAT
jgi:hypothetical protein